MIDWLCFGWRKGKKTEEFNGDKFQSFKNSSISNQNFESNKHGLKADTMPDDSSTVNKDEVHNSNNDGNGNQSRVFNYRELATATENFHPNNFLGEGGFGSVYKGTLLDTNEVVAVKRLNPAGFQGEKEFLVEVLMLSLLRHPNLVNMIGYCAEGTQRLLVLEFMPLGSLEAHLHDIKPGMKPLDWETRMKIAAGAAKGVDYLHREAKPPVIFRDLKPSNILLDEGFHPKLSDFGLAKFGPVGDNSHVSTRVMGTHGYCAPEYAQTGKLTAKSDTFSFGVVLLELISGRKAVDMTRLGGQTSLVDWAIPILHDRKAHLQLADPRLNGQFPVSALRKAISVAAMCLREDANKRPSMLEVVQTMEYLSTLKDKRPRSASVENVPTDSISVKETTKAFSHNENREQAVAEAKMWGEQWREMRRQSDDSSTVPKA
ncbi:hypothetical protein RND81_11G189300 [Saponaria officinalis]|uniref:Protein kinase domain-containing protein n=1 Tax=Saponaria officinalis TaxID=3572 RepID=A0AAW1HN25_SAPOF